MLVSFHALAKLELNEAAEYYERESAGLGQAFITEVERCTDPNRPIPGSRLRDARVNPSPSDKAISRRGAGVSAAS
jgi:hypothetical protein